MDFKVDISGSMEVNSVANYTFTMDRWKYVNPTDNVTVGSYIEIALGDEWSIIQGLFTCKAETWVFGTTNLPSLTCNITNNIIKVTGGFPTGYDQNLYANYKFTIINMPNPDVAGETQGITCQILKSNGVDQIDYQLNAVKLNFTEISLTSILTTDPSQVNNQTAILTVSMQLKNILYGNNICYIQINFPDFWDTSPYVITVITNSKGPIVCVENQTPKFNIQCDFIKNSLSPPYLKVYFANDIPSLTTISFNISSIVNPPSTQQAGIISIITYKKKQIAGQYKDRIVNKQENIKIGVTQPNILKNAQLTLLKTPIVNSLVNAQLTFYSYSPVNYTDYYLIITFPSEIKLLDTLSQPATGTDYCQIQFTTKATVSGQQIIFPVLYTFSKIITSTTYVNGMKCGINIAQIIYSPNSIKKSSSINITIYKDTFKVDEITTGITITAVKDKLTNASVTSDNLQIAATNVNYFFSIQLKNKLSKNGVITIKFPDTIKVNTRSGANCTGEGTIIQTDIKCNVTLNGANNLATFYDIFSTDLAGGESFKLTLSGVNNSLDGSPSTNFFISTYYENDPGTLVEDSTGLTITTQTTPGSINFNSVIITPGSLVAQAITTYTIQFTAKNGIPNLGKVLIILPDQYNGTISKPSCYYQSSLVDCDYNYVNGRGQFMLSNLTKIDPNQNVTIQLSQCIQNPPICKDYYSFEFYTQTKDGYSIDQIKSGLKATVNVALNFLYAEVNQTEKINNKPVVYEFYLTLTSNHPPNSYIGIKFPPTITRPSQLSYCIPISANWNTQNISCSIGNNNDIVVSLATISSTLLKQGVEVRFKIENVKNYYSMAPSQSFEIISYELDNNIKNIINQRLQNLIITNQVAATINQFTADVFQRDQYYMGSITSWIFTFKCIQLVPNNGVIRLRFPQGFTVFSNSTLTSLQGICNAQGNQYIIENSNTIFINCSNGYTYNSLEIRFQLSNIKNPSTDQHVNFTLDTFDEQNYTIDHSENLAQYILPCYYLCQTCDWQNTTKCITCYQDMSLTIIGNNRLFDPTTAACKSSCITHQYLDANKICQSCDNPCSECTSTSTKCTKCFTNQYLFNNTCVITCNSGWFIDLYSIPEKCSQCISPCKECFGYEINCTKCNDQNYMLGKFCQPLCPDFFYIANNGTRMCDYCDQNCHKCIDYTWKCTSCAGGLYLSGNTCNNTCQTGFVIDVQAQQCVSQCASPCASCSIYTNNCTTCIIGQGYLVENTNQCVQQCGQKYVVDTTNNKCISCQQPCATCSIFSANCTSCDQSLYLQGGLCVNSTQCQPGYYPEPSNMTCALCISPCVLCSSAKICKTCVLGKFFLNSNCYDFCPEGYVNDGGFCVICQTGCSICENNTYTCTKCQPTYYYLKNIQQCTQNCTPLYPQNGECVTCQSPCKNCLTTQFECSSCINNTYLYKNQCLNSCPDELYPEQGTNLCKQCFYQCRTCQNYDQCITCNTSFPFLQGTQCFSQCPPDAPIPIGTSCKQCMANCQRCTTLTDCQLCKLPYLMLKEQCTSQCPSNYQPSPDYSQCVLRGTAELLKENYEQGKLTPFPFLISFFVLGVSVAISKFSVVDTHVAGALLGFGALLELGSWAALGYQQYESVDITSFQTQITAGVIGVLYFCNVVYLWLYKRFFSPDPEYIDWRKIRANIITVTVINICALLTSFKVGRMLYSKFFGFSFFRLKLTSIESLSPVNKLTGLSLVLNSIPMLVTASVTAYYDEKKEQLFLSALDVIIVTIIMLILMICEAKKPVNFFEEYTAQQNLDNQSLVSNSRIIFPEQSINKPQKSPSSKTDLGINLQRRNSNSSIGEFTEQRKVFKEEQERPLSMPMNPNDVSLDSSMNQSLLGHNNNNDGSSVLPPLLQQQEQTETYKPGKKPVFTSRKILNPYLSAQQNKQLKPIQEKPREDDDEEMLNNSQQQGGGNYLYEQEDMLDQNRKTEKSGAGNGNNNDDESEEPLPKKPKINHTIYYERNMTQTNSLEKGQTSNIGVNVQPDEIDRTFEESFQQQRMGGEGGGQDDYSLEPCDEDNLDNKPRSTEDIIDNSSPHTKKKRKKQLKKTKATRSKSISPRYDQSNPPQIIDFSKKRDTNKYGDTNQILNDLDKSRDQNDLEKGQINTPQRKQIQTLEGHQLNIVGHPVIDTQFTPTPKYNKQQQQKTEQNDSESPHKNLKTPSSGQGKRERESNILMKNGQQIVMNNGFNDNQAFYFNNPVPNNNLNEDLIDQAPEKPKIKENLLAELAEKRNRLENQQNGMNNQLFDPQLAIVAQQNNAEKQENQSNTQKNQDVDENNKKNFSDNNEAPSSLAQQQLQNQQLQQQMMSSGGLSNNQVNDSNQNQIRTQGTDQRLATEDMFLKKSVDALEDQQQLQQLQQQRYRNNNNQSPISKTNTDQADIQQGFLKDFMKTGSITQSRNQSVNPQGNNNLTEQAFDQKSNNNENFINNQPPLDLQDNSITNNNFIEPSENENMLTNENQINKLNKKSKNNDQNQQKIYDSKESLHTASEAEMDFNEISPTDFNNLNQRYEDDFIIQAQQTPQAINNDMQDIQFPAQNQIQYNNSNINTNLNYALQPQNSHNSIQNYAFQKNGNPLLIQPQNGQFTPSVADSVTNKHKFIGGAGGPMSNTSSQISMVQKNPKQNKKNNLTHSRQQDYRMPQQTTPSNYGSKLFKGQDSDNDYEKSIQNQFAQTPQPQNYDINQHLQQQNQKQQQQKQLPSEQDSDANQVIRTNQLSQNSYMQGLQYKTPNIDMSKLKSLERIYLQRIDNNMTGKSSKKKLSKLSARKSKQMDGILSSSNGREPKDLTDALYLEDNIGVNDFQDEEK